MDITESKDLTILKAKNAIFKLLGQYCQAVPDNDGVYWVSDYYQSALEYSFDVLGIKEDRITLKDFCQMWEDNNRSIWAITIPDREYDGITAQIYYNCFSKLRKGEYDYD